MIRAFSNVNGTGSDEGNVEDGKAKRGRKDTREDHDTSL